MVKKKERRGEEENGSAERTKSTGEEEEERERQRERERERDEGCREREFSEPDGLWWNARVTSACRSPE